MTDSQVPITDLMVLNNNILTAIDNLSTEQLTDLLTKINNNTNPDSIILDLADGEYDNNSQINLEDIKNGMVTNKIDAIEEVVRVDESMIDNVTTIVTDNITVYEDITLYPKNSEDEIDISNKFKLKTKLENLETSIEGLQKSLEQMETKINQHSHSSNE